MSCTSGLKSLTTTAMCVAASLGDVGALTCSFLHFPKWPPSDPLHFSPPFHHQVEHSEVEAMMVLPVYGAMSTKAQQQIFMRAPPGVRKVVVATDIASTSLTVDGVV